MTAFRDPAYPFTPEYWPNVFTATILRIDSVDMPALYFRAMEEDLMIKVQVSEVLYPEGTSKLAGSGEVSVSINDLTYKAEGAGIFEIIIPADDLKDLEEVSYTVLINALIEGIVPVSVASSILIY